MLLDVGEIPNNPRIVVLTGAGISAESGLSTFRGADGLWEGHRVEAVATPEAFGANPALVQKFYNMRRQQLTSGEVLPNSAHKALAELQSIAGSKMMLVTQNVDDLHDRCHQQVLHMHGELLASFCTQCAHKFTHTHDISPSWQCEKCEAVGTTRPDIVWFGEMPKYMAEIDTAIAHCDVFIAIGTSGKVYPAAGFVQQAKQHQAYAIEVNIDSSDSSDWFDLHILGKAGEQVPSLVNSLKPLYQ